MNQTDSLARTSGADDRLLWVDSAKGLSIALVVLRHTWHGLNANGLAAPTPTAIAIDQWFLVFRMPLFFFVSGIFLVRSAKRPYRRFVSDRIRTIVYPYFVWSWITITLQLVFMRRGTNGPRLTDFFTIPYEPVFQFWFLYVLFILAVATAGLLKIGLRPWMLVVLTLVLGSRGFPLPRGFSWGPLFQIREHALYLALGVWLGSQPELLRRSVTARVGPLLLIAGIGFAGLTALVRVHDVSRGPWELLAALLGGSGCAALMMVIAPRARVGALLRSWGRYSLEIYVAHVIVAAGFRVFATRVLHIRSFEFNLILGVLFGIYVPLLVGMLCRKLGIRYVFTWPAPQRDVPGRSTASIVTAMTAEAAQMSPESIAIEPRA